MPARSAELRTWTDQKGNAIEAELVGIQGEEVILEKAGVRRRFRLQQLSYEDRRFIQQRLKEIRDQEWASRPKTALFTMDEEEKALLEKKFAPLREGLYPKSKEAIKERLRVLEKTPVEGDFPRDHVEALNRLNSYRYLCDLPSDVGLNAEYSRKAKAAATVCRMLGRLDHNPPNPGMPEDEYQVAREGAGHSNLFGGGSVPSSVNGYMNDSDPGNIDRLGHRRWCLNPRMAETGFGSDEGYAAMWSMDGGRAKDAVPDYDFIAYPARGYMPMDYFREGYAWSVTLNPGKYASPEALTQEQVKVYPLSGSRIIVNESSRKEPLDLAYFNVDLGGYGVSNCIIFKPAGLDFRTGARYWVEITGLEKKGGGEARIGYLVEFANL